MIIQNVTREFVVCPICPWIETLVIGFVLGFILSAFFHQFYNVLKEVEEEEP